MGSLSLDFIGKLKAIVGEDWVVQGEDLVASYVLDETPPPIRPQPHLDVAVVKPNSSEEVSEILKLANQYDIPVFPRGGGTGLVGGCIPIVSGIILSLERMNKIVVDRDNLMAEAEAGATLRDLLNASDEAGLFFPPHPGDEGAQIGGLIACNAGGARAIKTGVMRNYVRGLEVVLPTGEIIKLGGKLLKNNFGFDLMQLIIGSEGTLAVITKAWIRLYPKLPATATLIIPFESRSTAVKAVPKILHAGILPLALEYVEKIPIERSAERLGLKWPCRVGESFLIVILAEQSNEALYSQCERLLSLCEEFGSLEPLLAESREEQENILKIRSEIYPSLKPDMVDILDATVPPASIGLFMDMVEEIGKSYNTYLPSYGHAADGNIHVHIMKEQGWCIEDYDKVRDEIYAVAVELGGTITGEHGIGAVRRKSVDKFLSPIHIKLMKGIKHIFDPKNILNPGKVLP
ncbi:MAG: FAD-binding oxidoreductase [Candidatus Bathyarchaeia archaeon]